MKNTSCQTCGDQFQITEDDLKFYEKMSPRIAGKMFPIPQPDMCPSCRCQLRVSHRNEQYLYNNKSAFTQKPLVSIYSPQKMEGQDFSYKIYSEEEWISDAWDAMEYGRDFDFDRPFFEQFYDLDKDVPRANLMTVVGTNDNSPYTTGTGYCKNCHLINSSEYCEDCLYGKLYQKCRSVIDSSYVYDSELIYECFSVRNCYNCAYLSYSQNCFDCFYSENLNSCKNCCFCTNLTRQEYCFMNEQLTKEEYQKRIKEYFGSFSNVKKAKKIIEDLKKKRIHKYANIVNCEESSGDFLLDSKNCVECYDVNDSEDCKYVQVGVKIKDVMDSSNMYVNPELCYECLGTLEVYNVIFSIYIFHSQNVMYSQQCYDCKNVFGCSGLRHKEYCILNKQYTKEEYEEMVPKIIKHMDKHGEWGKFFPASMSPFGYNESLASDYFPLTRAQALAKGLKWRDEDPDVEYQGPNYEIPDNIKDVKGDICDAILRCEVTGKLYKIMPQELKFYKQMNLPIPRRCPDQRHKDRMEFRNPRKLWDKECNRCHKGVKTTYSPDRPEKVCCERCYLEEVH